MIDISHIGKAEALRRLYNASKPLGMGFLHFTAEEMTLSEAESLVASNTYFDYLKGRVMKVDLTMPEFDPRLYDRDNGQGAAERAIKG